MITKSSTFLAGASLLVFAVSNSNSLAYPRYYNDAKDDFTNCSLCHGNFTGSTSPKGTTFPSGDKHEMHRANSNMNTECDLCHTTGDNRNPYMASSDGTGNNPGLGCSGCHNGPGLRAHHAANGIMTCYTVTCHDPETAPPENVPPPYYGTVDTKVDNPCNDVAASGTNENWSIGDFLGTDNDGNNVYDRLDPACSPYRIVAITVEGDDVRITWETTGGRTDVLQSAPAVAGGYSNVGSPIVIPGSVVVTTNRVEVGGATGSSLRSYRLELIP